LAKALKGFSGSECPVSIGFVLQEATSFGQSQGQAPVSLGARRRYERGPERLLMRFEVHLEVEAGL
jgi:hypothetical protein